MPRVTTKNLPPDEIVRRFRRRRSLCLWLGLPPFLGCFAAVAAHQLGWISGVDLMTALLPTMLAVIVLWLLAYRCPNCDAAGSTTDGESWLLNPEECRTCVAALRDPRAR